MGDKKHLPRNWSIHHELMTMYFLTDHGIVVASNVSGLSCSGRLLHPVKEIYKYPYSSLLHHIGIYQQRDNEIGSIVCKCFAFQNSEGQFIVFKLACSEYSGLVWVFMSICKSIISFYVIVLSSLFDIDEFLGLFPR